MINEDGYVLTVPLYAYKPKAVIVFEPFVNLGFVPVNGTKTKTVRFINEGSLADTIHLPTNFECLEIVPSTFELKPDKS